MKNKLRLLAGSNHRPLVYKTSALATELKSHTSCCKFNSISNQLKRYHMHASLFSAIVCQFSVEVVSGVQLRWQSARLACERYGDRCPAPPTDFFFFNSLVQTGFISQTVSKNNEYQCQSFNSSGFELREPSYAILISLELMYSFYFRLLHLLAVFQIYKIKIYIITYIMYLDMSQVVQWLGFRALTAAAGVRFPVWEYTFFEKEEDIVYKNN